MAFEISLRLPFSLPRLLRAHSDEPQKEYHWINQTGDTPQGKVDSGNQGNKPEREKNDQGYRPLSKIKLGEVEDAINLFEHQLVPAHENWIGKNLFCTIPLKRKRDGRPPMIFGRVRTCYPSDGYLENVEDIELLFPRRDVPPDLVYLHKDEISLYSQRTVQSHYLRVQFKASAEDEADFEGSAPLFHKNGFHPEFDSDYYDLLEMDEQNKSAYPRLYVISSRWLASIPDSRYFEITGRLKEMLGWGKLIFNYHPDWLPKEIHPLNKALGLKYRLSKHYLTEPETPEETAKVLALEFNEKFKRGLMG